MYIPVPEHPTPGNEDSLSDIASRLKYGQLAWQYRTLYGEVFPKEEALALALDPHRKLAISIAAILLIRIALLALSIPAAQVRAVVLTKSEKLPRDS